jgi:SWIM zinc finger
MLSEYIEEWVKGFRYSGQPERLVILASGRISFKGNHKSHILMATANGLTCDCDAFQRFLPLGGWCRHTIAVNRILTALDTGKAVVVTAESIQDPQTHEVGEVNIPNVRNDGD